MAEVFADTGYWVAMLDPKGSLHRKALDVSKSIGKRRMVTTEMVLAELLGLLSAPPQRDSAAETVERLLRDPNVDVTPQTGLLFRDALSRYKMRSDKSWSLTDCASFIVMERREVKDALAYDRHFEQAGFVALLRD